MQRLEGERVRMNENLNNLALAWFNQEQEYQHMQGQVDMLMVFQVALQHGLGNPIEIEDNVEGEPVLGLRDGELVEIIEEDVPLQYKGLPEYAE